MKLKALLSLAGFLVGAVAWAAVPNTFTDGETVSAAKINENFAVASKALILKADGVQVGTNVGYTSGFAYFLSTKLYFLSIPATSSSPSLKQEEIMFDGAGCTGNAFTVAGSQNQVLKGFDNQLYYVTDMTYNSNMAVSKYGSGGCVSSSMSLGYPLSPNDETVTGFSDSLASATLSLTLE